MSAWQLLGVVLFVLPIVTVLSYALFQNATETWAVIWRFLICAAVIGVVDLGLLLMLGKLP